PASAVIWAGNPNVAKSMPLGYGFCYHGLSGRGPGDPRALAMTKNNGTVRLAAVADLHYGRASAGSLQWLSAAAERADILLIGGDLTDHGLPDEARALAHDLSAL